MKTINVIITAVLLISMIAVPAFAVPDDWKFTILSAQHRTGNCVWNSDITHFECDIESRDITYTLQHMVDDGYLLFRLNTTPPKGGIYVPGQRIIQLPQKLGNYHATRVTYQISTPYGAFTKVLAVRDPCWFNLGTKRVWCPATLIYEQSGLEAIDDSPIF